MTYSRPEAWSRDFGLDQQNLTIAMAAEKAYRNGEYEDIVEAVIHFGLEIRGEEFKNTALYQDHQAKKKEEEERRAKERGKAKIQATRCKTAIQLNVGGVVCRSPAEALQTQREIQERKRLVRGLPGPRPAELPLGEGIYGLESGGLQGADNRSNCQALYIAMQILSRNRIVPDPKRIPQKNK